MWCVRLSDSQRDALRELVEGQEKESISDSLRAAFEALELARWDDLPDASLPWDRVADLARRQEIGEADVVWDLTGGAPDPPKRKPARKRATKKPARR